MHSTMSMSKMGKPSGQFEFHDEVSLWIISNRKDMSTYFTKAPLRVKTNSSLIFLPDAQPDAIAVSSLSLAEGCLHEFFPNSFPQMFL